MSQERDIGGGVVIRWVTDEHGQGLNWKHPGCRVWFWLYFKPSALSTGHELVAGDADNLDALTIRGSLLCPKGCGKHGTIESGRWKE